MAALLFAFHHPFGFRGQGGGNERGEGMGQESREQTTSNNFSCNSNRSFLAVGYLTPRRSVPLRMAT